MEAGIPRDRSRRSASKARWGGCLAIHATPQGEAPNRSFVTEQICCVGSQWPCSKSSGPVRHTDVPGCGAVRLLGDSHLRVPPLPRVRGGLAAAMAHGGVAIITTHVAFSYLVGAQIRLARGGHLLEIRTVESQTDPIQQ